MCIRDRYSTGCGHAVIAISTVLVETGIINVIKPETEINMDVPSGTIKSYVKVKNNKVNSVRFLNVPSFVELLDASISISGLGIINYDLAYGGAYYAIVKGEDLPPFGVPESFNVLIKELQGLGLDLELD